MIKILIVILISVLGIVRWFIARNNNKSSNFLLVSLFIQTLPFGYGKAIYTFLLGLLVDDEKQVLLGAFGNSIRIELGLVFFIFLLSVGFSKLKNNRMINKDNRWFYVILIYSLITFLNPSSVYPLSFLPLISMLLQLLIVLRLLEANVSRVEILEGIFDGLKIITIIQFSLTMLYPVLDIEAVAILFRGEDALEWAQRRQITSAIGTFGHPGTLALFCLVMAIFFLSCQLNKFRSRIASYLIILNLFVIFFTFSRTTYVCTLGILLLIFLVKIYKKGLFSFKNIFTFLVLFVFAGFILYLTPIGDLFIKSDANDQLENRLAHWVLGYQIWVSSPILGVGLNSHVYYMINEMNIRIDSPVITFLTRSPIHNIHMIVLAETGIIGFAIWLYYYTSRIASYSKHCSSSNRVDNIFNLTFVGILSSFFLYGFFGWSPFRVETLMLGIFLGFFARMPLNKY